MHYLLESEVIRGDRIKEVCWKGLEEEKGAEKLI